VDGYKMGPFEVVRVKGVPVVKCEMEQGTFNVVAVAVPSVDVVHVKVWIEAEAAVNRPEFAHTPRPKNTFPTSSHAIAVDDPL
jgi:hypothetical protein